MKWVKRCLDIVLSFLGLVIAAPIFAVIGILILINDGEPILFVQERVGKGERLFKMYKFRTMEERRDAQGNLLPDVQRVSNLGQALRSTSLDELPELFNVLKGDMSIVGPRPLLAEYVPLYSKTQKKRLEVLPGITGWAQINGRNSITWCKKFELDIWYVENWSIWLDIKIAALTVYKVIKREGINQAAGVTAEKFNGYN